MSLVGCIRRLCLDHGISIAQLERETGLASRTIGRWDESKPSVDKVQKVAEYFDVSVDYLLGIEKEPVATDGEELGEYLEMLRTSPGLRMMMKTQRNATKEQIEQNVKFLQVLKEGYYGQTDD